MKNLMILSLIFLLIGGCKELQSVDDLDNSNFSTDSESEQLTDTEKSTDTKTEDETDTNTETENETDNSTDSSNPSEDWDTDNTLVWMDSTSGLIWQITPTSYFLPKNEAASHCDNLVLDKFDDWYLPNITELRSIVRGCDKTATGGTCGITSECTDSYSCQNEDCQGCSSQCYLPEELRGSCDRYWSSTTENISTEDTDMNTGWILSFQTAQIYEEFNTDSGYVRCVRAD